MNVQERVFFSKIGYQISEEKYQNNRHKMFTIINLNAIMSQYKTFSLIF